MEKQTEKLSQKGNDMTEQTGKDLDKLYEELKVAFDGMDWDDHLNDIREQIFTAYQVRQNRREHVSKIMDAYLILVMQRRVLFDKLKEREKQLTKEE